MTEASAYDQFESHARDYGVALTRVPAADATETIAAIVESPSVGAPLPWDDVTLPDDVTTDPTPAELDAAVTGVTAASLAVADYGSLFLRATPEGTEPASLFPDLHVAVLRAADIVPDMSAAFEWFGEQARASRDSGILATGPSATADMGELVKGAHGPKAVEVVVVE